MSLILQLDDVLLVMEILMGKQINRCQVIKLSVHNKEISCKEFQHGILWKTQKSAESFFDKLGL